jgi:hypothetical protein
MNLKETYTKIFLKELGMSLSLDNIKGSIMLWWQNTRNKGTGGLRLTEEGFDVLKKVEIEHWDIPYPKEMVLTPQVIVFLDQFIDCPYYLSKRSIVVTSERKAVELSLFSGDVRKYGLVKAMSRSKKLKNLENKR